MSNSKLSPAVIFVGYHNKEGKTPLCSSTKSGKVIDSIISGCSLTNFKKTNLFDTESEPSESEKYNTRRDWLFRVDFNKGDIIVLLGAQVHSHFPISGAVSAGGVKIIKLAHPASIFYKTKASQEKYIQDSITEINKRISNVTK